MEKHAYLIMGHNNFYNLKSLLKLLDNDANDIFVHIDKKVKSFDAESLKKEIQKASLHFYSEIKVNWGGYSQVRCELFLLKKALKAGDHMYYHLLSCADLPIKPQHEIQEFFRKNSGYEFVQYKDEQFKAQQRELTRRVTLYHWIQEYRKCSNLRVVKGTLTYIAKALMGFQIVLGINRLKGKNLELKYGSQWFSITQKFAAYVIKNEENIERIFKWTMCPDEFVIQTLLYRSKFRKNIYQYQCQNCEEGNMREINWGRSHDPAHPYVWRKTDFDDLCQSKMLFARKFDENTDREIIDMLYEEMREKNGC